MYEVLYLIKILFSVDIHTSIFIFVTLIDLNLPEAAFNVPQQGKGIFLFEAKGSKFVQYRKKNIY